MAEDLSLTAAAKKRIRTSSDEGSEIGMESFTEVRRKTKMQKEAGSPSAQTPAQQEVPPRQPLENIVFIEFVGHQINKINSIVVKRELANTVGCSGLRPSGNFLRVVSNNVEQKTRLLAMTQIGPYTVRVSEPRNLVRERAQTTRKVIRKIIVGVPVDIDEQDIKDEISASTSVVAVKRLLKKSDGVQVKTTAVLIEFPIGTEVPNRVPIGFCRYKVRDYVAPPTRCYKCLGFGHVAAHCQKGQKCSFCAGEHKHTECDKLQSPKCARCGGEHTTFDANCPAYAEAKQAASKAAVSGKTYAQALKAVRREAKASAQENPGQNAAAVQETAPARGTAVAVALPQRTGSMTVLRKGPAAQKAVTDSAPSLAASRTGGEAMAPEIQTTPATQSGPDMVAPVRAMIQAMLKLLSYVENTLVPQLLAGKGKDAIADVHMAFTKMIGLEFGLPFEDVLKTIMDHGREGSRAPGSESVSC